MSTSGQPMLPSANAYYPPVPTSHSGMSSYPSSTPLVQKPKVGLAVLCRCAVGNCNVQCLLQRRGPHSSSPNKWSFPGGRLEHPGDLENDGAVGTERELNDECGGGSPYGLPPLIHIECCKTGKQSQTLYHVYVVDISNKEWETWQPKYKNSKGGTELDTVVHTLNLQGKYFSCINGYCWVDMYVLIKECYTLNHMELGTSDLQYGLIRWVQNYGENILKTLIARSPKLPHPRRLSSTMAMPPQNGGFVVGMVRPRLSRQDSDGKPRFESGTVGCGMLHPNYQHGQFLQHNLQVGGNSPTNTYYNVLPLNQGRLSPPSAGSSAGNTPTNGGGGSFLGGLLMHMPPGHMSLGLAPSSPQGGLGKGVILVPPPISMVPPPSMDSPSQPAVSLPQTSSPTLHSQCPVRVSKTDTIGGGEVGLYQPPQTQSLMSTLNPLMATSALPVTVSPAPHTLTPAPRAGMRGSVVGQYDTLGSTHAIPVTSNQFLQTLPPSSSNTLLPILSHSHPLALPPSVAGPHATIQGGDSEPLLPNPPLHSSASFLPLMPSMQVLPPPPHVLPPLPPPPHLHQHGSLPGIGGSLRGILHQHPNSPSLSSRKEIVCRHYMHGLCPFGEKCWFAHPELHQLSQLPRLGGPPGQALMQGLGSSSPLNVQVPSPQFWVSNPQMDYAGLASPPQSPINPALMPRPPMVPAAMFRPRGCMSYPPQQPFMFFRGGLIGSPRNPGSNLPLPIPMPTNPLLKFVVLSQVILQSYEGVGSVQTMSQLATYADHFFVSYNSLLITYRIIFGGNRNYQESAVPTEKKKLDQVLSCLHCSKMQPMLLLLGTETGDVLFLDMRKGGFHGNFTPVHSAESLSPSEPIITIIHFSTSINSAQVVVSGTQLGSITWYISQPPQKTYSLLYADREAHAPNKILALQMLGGFLVSADCTGCVVVWSMMNHTPTIHSSFRAHTLSLTNLHVVDANYFLSIGTDTGSDESRSDSETDSAAAQVPPVTEPFTVIPTSSEDFEVDMANLSLNLSDDIGIHALSPPTTLSPLSSSSTSPPLNSSSSSQFAIKLWEFDKPPKLSKVIRDIGPVICSSFHCHNPPGNMFLGLGMRDGVVKVYNVPTFMLASELHFELLSGKDCVHIQLNLSREAPLITQAYYRNPFRDLILTSVWSDRKIFVCQVAKQ